MAADSPQAALDRFVRPFRQALACLTDAYLADERPANRRAALLFPAANANRGYIRLASQHPQLRGIGFLEFRFIHGDTLAQHDEGWDAHTTSYAYEFQPPDGREGVAYHYEPGPNSRGRRRIATFAASPVR